MWAQGALALSLSHLASRGDAEGSWLLGPALPCPWEGRNHLSREWGPSTGSLCILPIVEPFQCGCKWPECNEPKPFLGLPSS